MKKTIIEKKEKEKLLLALNNFGINDDLIEIAKKMGLDLITFIYEKVINNYNPENYEVVVKSLLGVYGNYIATNHFSNLGYSVLNEVAVRNKLGLTVTNADLMFTDENGHKNFCEVKAASQIIDNIRNYKDPDVTENQKCFEDKDDEILKYKCIGKKLIKQVGKLAKKDVIVKVIIFEGCYVDDIIRKKISDLGATIVVLKPNIYDLENSIKDTLDKIICYVKEDNLKKIEEK